MFDQGGGCLFGVEERAKDLVRVNDQVVPLCDLDDLSLRFSGEMCTSWIDGVVEDDHFCFPRLDKASQLFEV